MIKKLRFIFFTTFLTITLVVFSTEKVREEVDSLKLIVKSSGKDSTLVQNYLRLANLSFNSNIKESGVYANKAHHISKQLNYSKGKADALLILGNIDFKQGKPHLGINHLKRAGTLYSQQKNLKGIAKTHEDLGKIYSAVGDMVKAIENHQQAIKFHSQHFNEKGVADCYSNLGQTHFLQKNYSTALRYYKKAKTIYQRDSIEGPIAKLYNRISLVFRELNDLDKSLEYDYLALMTQERLRDKQGIANSNYNIGKTSILQNEIKRAQGYIEYAEKLYLELQDNLGIAKCLLLNANISISEKKYDKATAFLNRSITISKEHGAIKELSDAYFLRSQISAKAEKFEDAYFYLSLHAELNDTLFSNEKFKQFSEMEVKYQSRSKDNALDMAKQEKEDDYYKFIVYISLSIAIFVMLGYVIVLMQRKNKEIKVANLSIENSSELIKARNKEIIDSISYAKKIQDAILTPQTILDNIFSDHFVYYRPKDIVSGDFYWAHKDTASNKVFWVTADCTGHGVPGALMSVIGTIILNEIIIVRRQHEPSAILNSLSKYLKKYLNKNKNDISQDGIELTLVVLDHDNKTLKFSGANRNLIIIRENELIELKGNKRPIGFDPFNRELSSFTCETMEYKKGDALYAFTDGYTDQIGGLKKQKYRVGVLKKNLLEISHLPMSEQKTFIEINQKKWMDGNNQLDDILVIGVKI